MDVYLFRIAFAAAGMAQGATADETVAAYEWMKPLDAPASIQEAYEMIELAFRVTRGD